MIPGIADGRERCHWRRRPGRRDRICGSNGGLGFLLGDGRENILETYYTLHVWRGAYPSFGFQYADHPGYNRDRGPVLVPSLRLHLEF